MLLRWMYTSVNEINTSCLEIHKAYTLYMKGFNNPNQLNIFNAPPPLVEQDGQGRTRYDIEKACKSFKESVLKSITLINGHWYIEGIDADEWIKQDTELNEIDNWTDH